MLITFSVSVQNTIFSEIFFPSTLIKDSNIRNSESYAKFKKSILRFIGPSKNPIFNYHNPIRIITRLRLGLSHLCEPKFRHHFQDTLNPICSCREKIETTKDIYIYIYICIYIVYIYIYYYIYTYIYPHKNVSS